MKKKKLQKLKLRVGIEGSDLKTIGMVPRLQSIPNRRPYENPAPGLSGPYTYYHYTNPVSGAMVEELGLWDSGATGTYNSYFQPPGT